MLRCPADPVSRVTQSLDRNTDAAEAHIRGLMSILTTLQLRDASMYASGLTMLKLCLL